MATKVELTRFLLKHGFQQLKHDYSLFTRNDSNSFLIVLVYVDDLLLKGTNVAAIVDLKHALHLTFTIKDLSETRFFLEFEIYRTSHGILVSQRKHVLDILIDLA